MKTSAIVLLSRVIMAENSASVVSPASESNPTAHESSTVTPPQSFSRDVGIFARLTERQVGIAVLLLGFLLFIPMAGTYGLWDPWETHYGEVARQMTKRGDFISLWWPGSPAIRLSFGPSPFSRSG